MRTFCNNVLSIGILLNVLMLTSCGGDDDDTTPANPLNIEDFEVTTEENASNGQQLGTVNASSSDGEAFTLSLSDESPDGALSIAADGELTVNDESLFDFETHPTITAVVTIASGDFSKTADVTILLTDVFEGIIWAGDPMAFSKADGADPADSVNQDRITDNVWITRADSGQLYNVKVESVANQTDSPLGTEWAVGNTDQISNLVFQPFRAAVGAPKDVVGLELVMHLITDDIYIDVEFTSWSQGKNGGFSYERSTANE